MVYLFLADGFEEIEALTPVDVLRRAGISVTTVSVKSEKTVTGSHNIKVVADRIESDLAFDDVTAIILPGGMPGTLNLFENKRLCELVKSEDQKETLICAICAAPLILGRLGVLEGKCATCFPGFENELAGAKVSDELVVCSENVITAKGMGVSLEFSSAIVERLLSKEAAQRIVCALQTRQG